MRFTGPAGEPRQTVGVIGALELEPPGAGILPHEETTPKAKTDRLDLLTGHQRQSLPDLGPGPRIRAERLLHAARPSGRTRDRRRPGQP